MVLKPAKIRGVASEGMVCSEKELGISDSHEGILVLPPEAPIGVPLGAYLGDIIFDLDVTPNRPDCLSVIGVAREIAALTGGSLHLPKINYKEAEESIDSFASVDIAEPDLCPRYCASLISGIKIAPSPGWLQQRLNSCGMRPINNVVDVTNYVMLEYGQPLHAFDYHKLKGRQIIVRRAGNGETMTTIDGTKRNLNPDILLIADKEEAIAVAGIMGGLDSEVTDRTDTILLESANFNQAAIRRGCGHLQLQSEASIRFDKGLNSELPLLPLKRATQLLLELAGGRAAKGIIDVYPGKSKPKPILLTAREVERLSGKLRNILAGFGFQEILTYSLVSLEKLQRLSPKLELKIPPLKVANPMTREQEYLRTSLRAGLLATLSPNQKFEQAGIRLFEIGKVFLPQHSPVIASKAKQSQEERELPQEREMLCAVLSGPRAELSWQADKGPLGFFDAKGVAECLLNQLGLRATFDIGDDEILFPGGGADIIVEDDKVGIVGEVHPRVAQAFELSDAICLIEIDLEKLLTKITAVKEYQPIPRFPSVTRDIALVVDEQASYRRAEETIQSFPLVTEVTLFDLYRGKQISKGKKSFAIRIIYKSPKHTLTDEEVDQTQEQMLARLNQELGATLRD